MSIMQSWLECNISEGLLPDEYAVKCNSADGHIFSFFAPSDFIDVNNNLVKVHVMECQNDYCLIYVPFEPLEGLGRTVKVSTVDLKNNGKQVKINT